MLRLNLKKEPYWLELPANVRLYVRPLTTAIMSAAQSQVIKRILAMREERKADPTLPDIDDEQTRLGLSESLLIKALARGAVIEWQGVMMPESDDPASVNDQTVQDLMDIWFIAQEFWKQYTSSLFLLEAEGNGSGLAANGTMAAGRGTATRAKKQISRAAGAAKTPSPANTAPTSSTSP